MFGLDMQSKDKDHITVPVFPLNYLVLVGEKKELHIFEARYKELINDCLRNNACFGIALPDKNSIGISKFGIMVRVYKIKKTSPSGEMDIIVEGVNIFKTIQFVPVLSPKLYGAATAELIFSEDSLCSTHLLKSAGKYLKLTDESFSLLHNNTTISQLACKIPLSKEERLNFISITDSKGQDNFLNDKIKLLIKLCEIEKKLNGDFWLN